MLSRLEYEQLKAGLEMMNGVTMGRADMGIAYGTHVFLPDVIALISRYTEEFKEGLPPEPNKT